jgi:endonuclease VIII
MAEGDTILRAAQRLEGLVGEEVAVAAPNPRGLAAGIPSLDRRRLDRVEARGKNLLLHFGGLVLHSHLGMSGSWHLYPRGGQWHKPPRSAWAVLGGSELEAVQFGGTTMRVLGADRMRRDPWLSRLGPDILAADIDLDTMASSLCAAATDRELGDALLDQTLVAGIGNIFKSEACFAARVSPWVRVGDLSQPELRAVLAAAHWAMRAAVAEGRPRLAVYRRNGRPCGRCRRTPIRARGQGEANRTTYWCPACQGRRL